MSFFNMPAVDFFGWTSTALMICAFYIKNDRWLRIMLSLGLILLSVHLYMKGADTGAVICVIGLFRNVASQRWHGVIAVMLGLMLTDIIVTALTWGGLASGLALAADLTTILAMFLFSGFAMRMLFFPLRRSGWRIIMWSARFPP